MKIQRKKTTTIEPKKWIKRLTFADPGSGVTASGASALLQMEATASAPDAEGVGLVPPLSKAPCSFTLLVSNKIQGFLTDHVRDR